MTLGERRNRTAFPQERVAYKATSGTSQSPSGSGEHLAVHVVRSFLLRLDASTELRLHV